MDFYDQNSIFSQFFAYPTQFSHSTIKLKTNETGVSGTWMIEK